VAKNKKILVYNYLLSVLKSME